MEFLYFLIAFFSIATVAILPQDRTEPVDLLKPNIVDSNPTSEKIKSPKILDLNGQGEGVPSFGLIGSDTNDLIFSNLIGEDRGQDLTNFNLIKPGSIPSTPAFSGATFNLIGTGSNSHLLDGSGTPDLTAFTGTENSNGKSLDLLASNLYTPDHICNSATRVGARQQCLDLHNILNEDYQMELRQLQGHTSS